MPPPLICLILSSRLRISSFLRFLSRRSSSAFFAFSAAFRALYASRSFLRLSSLRRAKPCQTRRRSQDTIMAAADKAYRITQTFPLPRLYRIGVGAYIDVSRVRPDLRAAVLLEPAVQVHI